MTVHNRARPKNLLSREAADVGDNGDYGNTRCTIIYNDRQLYYLKHLQTFQGPL